MCKIHASAPCEIYRLLDTFTNYSRKQNKKTMSATRLSKFKNSVQSCSWLVSRRQQPIQIDPGIVNNLCPHDLCLICQYFWDGLFNKSGKEVYCLKLVYNQTKLNTLLFRQEEIETIVQTVNISIVHSNVFFSIVTYYHFFFLQPQVLKQMRQQERIKM